MWDGTYPGKQTINIAAGVYLVKNVVVTRAGARSAVMYGGAVGRDVNAVGFKVRPFHRLPDPAVAVLRISARHVMRE